MTAGAALLVTALGIEFGACTLTTQGTGPDLERCQLDAQCTTCAPCCTGKCADGTCQYSAISGDPVQTPGDCQHIACDGLNPVSSPDPSDIADDGDSCTADSCQDGAPRHDPLSDGAPCNVGTAQGSCKTGECKVSCGNDKPCDDGNRCTTDSCDGQDFTCDFVKLDGVIIPGLVDTPGDCVSPRCVNGVANPTFPDENDVYNDGKECTSDTCVNGRPQNPPLSAETKCGPDGNLFCDGNGACVGCVADNDCSDPMNECLIKHCDAQKECNPTPVSSGTALSQQTAGDCHLFVCDGMGGTTAAVDDTDVPNDNNPCTADACSGGTPSHTPQVGQACSGGVCDANGDCCAPASCASLGAQCGTPPDGCLSVLNCGTCSVDPPSSCGHDGSCTSSFSCGFYNTTTQCQPAICVDGPPASQTAAKFCNGSGSCSGGGTVTSCGAYKCNTAHTACLTTCTSSNDCATGSYCDATAHCVVQKTNGKTCMAAGECQSGNCVEGVCCNSQCSLNATNICMTCLKAHGAPSDGTCGQAAALYDPSNLCGASKCCTGNPGECCSGMGAGCGSNCLE